MLGAGEGTHLGLRIKWISQTNASGQSQEALEELVCNALMQHQARAGNAGLTLIVKNSPSRAVDGRRYVRVLEYDVCALAAELQLYLLQVGRGSMHDVTASGGRTGKGDLGDFGMLGDILPRYSTKPRHHIDYAVRQAGLRHQLRDSERGQRRDLGRLHHDAVPGR